LARELTDEVAELISDYALKNWRIMQERTRLTKDYKTTKDFARLNGRIEAAQYFLQYIIDKRGESYHVPE